MADEALPYPPPSHGSPGLHEITPAKWWRVQEFDPVTGLYPAHRFKDSARGNARFSPLACGARVVPTLYAANSLAGALMETVLHDVPYPSVGHDHDLERDLSSNLRASTIVVAQPIRVVALTKLGLQRMGIRPSEMFETDADDYPRTRAWAQWLHQAAPDAQGLMWLSARDPQSTAIMLFGDRIRPHAVVPTRPEETRPLCDPDVYATLLGLLDRLGCGVASNR